MAKFFIDRPVFAWVVAIVIMLAGVLAVRSLPIAQYPDIAPPSVTVTAVYPGASAEAVEESVTQVIEQRMTGIDGLDYISSSSSSSGQAQVTLTFVAGTDPDIAQVQVQNKLSLATPLLPGPVQRQGVVVSKASPGFLMVLALTSPNGTHDQTDLGDYARSTLIDPLSRVSGVGNAQLFGSPYAMRIWLNPNRLTEYGLMPQDVIAAIRAQNAQVSAGALGGTPSVPGQEITATITVQSLLSTPDDFRSLLIRTTTGGGTVRLGDVARVEMGAENYGFIAKYSGMPAAGMAISLAAGANAIETAEEVKHLLDVLAVDFPADMAIRVAYDTTPFVEQSIHEVEKTLIEAIVLVLLVILVFLQSFRAAFIPMIAVPVVLLGNFAVLAMFGFSINTLTMFAMVLAIGLLVDDAIVVVENVERVMREDGLSPREATRKSMSQITGALVGIAVVLSAVFVPMAFFPGSVGVIYRQFSVTIVSAMVLSVIVAIVLSPALCATILKPHDDSHDNDKRLDRRAARGFNRRFDRLRDGYAAITERLVRRRWIFVGGFAVGCLILAFGFLRLPTSFLPNEDQGALITMAQLPVGAGIERTVEVMDGVYDYFSTAEDENIIGAFTLSGFNFAGQGQNMGIAFVALQDWKDRKGADDAASAIAGRAMGRFSQETDAQVFVIAPPPIRELGNATGFDLFLQDSGGVGRDALLEARNQFLGMARSNPKMVGVRPNGQDDSPEFNVNLDYQKAQAIGVSIGDATSLMSTALSSTYVNDFVDRGRIKRVYVQGDAEFRMQPEDIGQWHVRAQSGEMVPLSTLISSDWQFGPPQLRRYNGLPALNIQGQAAAGESSGAAMAAAAQIVDQLPPGIEFEWSGLSRQEAQSGNQAALLYAVSLLFVFLCLAALYESWTVPIAVLLVAPAGVAGAVLFAHMRGLSNDVFFQVGLLTTVGLASKNAILIVEFAKELEEKGRGLIDATLEAVRIRFRPIIMTSLAFGFGVTPLALGTGAGAGARQALGTAVLGGMIAATVLGLFCAPVFYVVVRKIFGRGGKPETRPSHVEAASGPEGVPAE